MTRSPTDSPAPRPEAHPPSVRLDKWLWAVRVFKTRGLAASACRQGHVTIAGQAAKPSREVRANDLVVVLTYTLTRTFKVVPPLDRRVAASAAREFVEDQTPASEFEKARVNAARPVAFRPKGAGRPTKKERRILDRWTES